MCHVNFNMLYCVMCLSISYVILCHVSCRVICHIMSYVMLCHLACHVIFHVMSCIIICHVSCPAMCHVVPCVSLSHVSSVMSSHLSCVMWRVSCDMCHVSSSCVMQLFRTFWSFLMKMVPLLRTFCVSS